MASYGGPVALSVLFFIPGFCIWRVCFDYMHTHELGTLQLVAPSLMKDLTKPTSVVFRGNTRQAKLNDAHRKYGRWCKERRVKSVIRKVFRENIWCKGKYPRISQLAAKAAALRAMTYWLADVCSRHTTTSHDATGACMIASFVEADRTLRGAGRFLTTAQHHRFCDAMESALVCYNALAVESYADGTFLWKCIPKHHAATHSYDSRTNPRWTHCYPDEDMVGRLKLIFNSCHGSTAPARSLQKYCILVGLRWWVALHSIRGLEYT